MNDLQLEDVEDYGEDYEIEYPGSQSDIHTSATSPKRRTAMGALICANKKISALLGLVLLIIAAIVGIVVSGNQNNGPNYHMPIVLIDPNSLDPKVTGPLMRTLLDLYDRHTMDPGNLDPKAGDATAQRRAFFWLAHDDKVNGNIGHRQKMQRYVMAVFYYATNDVSNRYEEVPKPWKLANMWMTSAHVCEWQGVTCNHDQHVVGIDMQSNYLTGKLPLELKIISDQLEKLDLSSNLINAQSGEDYDVFKHLTAITDLSLDDNFFEHENGLPPQFRHMANLRKLKLSYNLFQGQLDSGINPVFPALTELTHLEIESNYLTGTIPMVIGTYSELIYMYMRRNSLEFNLDFLKTGAMVQLFALWLDDNTVKGTIPTEVGLLTHMASFSITNSTLSGTIPSEIGQLSGLRRLWLFDNDLEGTIPSSLVNNDILEVLELQGNDLNGEIPLGVCTNFNKVSYEFKSMVTDCSVTCGCCTDCV